MRTVVNAPAGNIGKVLVETLLAAGEEVVILSRNPGKVADIVGQGAKRIVGSMDDAATLDQALIGASSLFWLTPPATRPDFKAWAGTTARQAAARAQAHGVGRVVVISSAGAHAGDDLGPVGALLPVENAFREKVKNVAALRAGFFFENLLHDVGSLLNGGAAYSPVPTHLLMPWVATKDIATTAASYLLTNSWEGHVIAGVHGPKHLSTTEAIAILGEVVGETFKHVEVSLDQAKSAMLGMGMPESIVNLYIEMYAAVQDGRMAPAEPRTPASTTPTSLRSWAKESFLPVWKASRAS